MSQIDPKLGQFVSCDSSSLELQMESLGQSSRSLAINRKSYSGHLKTNVSQIDPKLSQFVACYNISLELQMGH